MDMRKTLNIFVNSLENKSREIALAKTNLEQSSMWAGGLAADFNQYSFNYHTGIIKDVKDIKPTADPTDEKLNLDNYVGMVSFMRVELQKMIEEFIKFTEYYLL